EAHYHLGVALWYSDAKNRAVPELRESTRLDPASGATHAFLGTALREQGQLPEARLSLQRAIALLPPIAAAYIDLGTVFAKSGELNKALGQFETGLNSSAVTPAPDWNSAVASLREALTHNTASAEGHNVLGLLMGRQGAD